MQPTPPVLSEPNYLHLQYRLDLQVLVGRWLRQPTEEELHAGYFRLLEAAESHGARLWLVDARRRSHANQQGTPWMMEHFMPLLAARLREVVYLAYLFMPNHLTEIEQDVAVPPLSYFDELPYHIERFTEEQAAMQWLAGCRLRGG